MLKYLLKDSGNRVNFVATLMWLFSLIGSEILLLLGSIIAGALFGGVAIAIVVCGTVLFFIGCYVAATQLQCLAEAAGGINGSRGVEDAGAKMQFVASLLLALDFSILALTPLTGLILAIVLKNAWVFLIALASVLLPGVAAWANALMYRCLGDMAGGDRKTDCFLLRGWLRSAAPTVQLLVVLGLMFGAVCIGLLLTLLLTWGITSAANLALVILLGVLAAALLAGFVWFMIQCVLAMSDALHRGLLNNAGRKTQMLASIALLVVLVLAVALAIAGFILANLWDSTALLILAIVLAVLAVPGAWLQALYMQAMGDAAHGEAQVWLGILKPFLGNAGRKLHRFAAIILLAAMIPAVVLPIYGAVRVVSNLSPTMADAVEELRDEKPSIGSQADDVSLATGNVKLSALIKELKSVNPDLADTAKGWITPENYTLLETVQLLKYDYPDVNAKAMDAVLTAGDVKLAKLLPMLETVSPEAAALVSSWKQEAEALVPGDYTLVEAAAMLSETHPDMEAQTIAVLTELSHLKISDLADMIRPVKPTMASMLDQWTKAAGKLLSGKTTLSDAVILLAEAKPEAEADAQRIMQVTEHMKLSALADMLEPVDPVMADVVDGWRKEILSDAFGTATTCVLSAAAIFLCAWALALSLQALSDAADKRWV